LQVARRVPIEWEKTYVEVIAVPILHETTGYGNGKIEEQGLC
jgi:hypothetical protein